MAEAQASEIDQQQHRPIPRRSHKKSKSGCRTCKVRKVKCDEHRPACQNCQRRYPSIVSCDFDDQEPKFRPIPSPSAESSHQARTGQSRRISVPGELTVRPTGSTGRLAEPLQIPLELAADRLDPFEARPATQEPAPSVDALLSHYLSNFAYRSFPFYASRPLIELWWPFVRADEVLFHVVLLLSSLDRANLQGSNDSLHTRRLLDQCLTLLNTRVMNPVAGINDHTLVAVSSLAAMEHDRGNMRALDMHLEGLKRIVELRGGLNVIRSTNPMASNIVFWCAMVSINEPQLLPLTYGDGARGIASLENPALVTLLTHDGDEKNLLEFGVDVTTANILHEVQRVSRLYTSTGPIWLLQMSHTAASDSPIPGLSQSCRLAGCLHVFTPMSGYFPNPTLMLHTIVRDLKASLTHLIRALGTRSHLLLWLLAVGGITAHYRARPQSLSHAPHQSTWNAKSPAIVALSSGRHNCTLYAREGMSWELWHWCR
ncbi:hypothetical protein BAUCODRAFT_23055 [Baudoinia panamericana UAMH 10762]|uniref:Zn(2)-C6 fungal-type domain-containing protein n=1 Tax=Baudoinia panamericana (strain UAMH 10762) TaxID=717646 RepID=M2LUI4_BAUPA|nr:uncharacterized protein BAUCODRAFT_23055 [Baudoinia panamericana UAMH 10762]EMC98247.1 hypothetical protein BAUCODRAFT_23055 [Baudoinia panamericana UAMH 10762]